MPPTQPTVDGSFILLVADSIEKMGEKIKRVDDREGHGRAGGGH